jgi:phosphoglycerate-specific signal transduction histidine kinase
MTATDLIAPPVPTGSIGSSDTHPAFAGAEQKIRFGVAFRLLIAFAAITAFAALTSTIALYTFGKFGQGFNRIASSSLPALVAASDLAQRSEALAANAPNLAVADGHFARRAISEALGNRLQSIADAAGQIRKLAPSTEGLVSLTQDEALLKDNIQKLDELVAEKIDADRVAANFMLRLRTLFVRIRRADSDLLSTLAGQQNERTQADALGAWIAAADEAIVILLSTASADTTIRLNRLR